MADGNALNLDANFKPVQQSIDKLISALDRLEKKLGEVAKTAPKFSDIFDTKGLNDLIASIKKLDAAGAQGFSSIIRSLTDLSNALGKLPTGATSIDVAKLGKDLADLFHTVQGLNVSFNKEQVQNLRIFINLLKTLGSLKDINLQAINISPEFTESIRNLVNSLAGIAPNSKQKVSFLEATLNALQGVFSNRIGTAGGQNLQVVSDSLLAFSRAIKNINSEIDDVNPKKIVTTFTQLAGSLQIIGFVLAKLPGGEQVNEFSKTFQRLGIGLSGIARGVEKIDNEAIVTIVKSFTAIGAAIKIISSVVRLGGDKNAEAFSRIFASVIEGIAQLNNIALVKNQNKLTLSIADQVKVVVEIIKAFSKLKGAQIPDIGSTIKAMSEAFKILSSELNIDPATVVNFEKFIDRIIKNVIKLNAVNVDTRKAEAIARQVEALSRLRNVEAQLREINTTLTFNTILDALPLVVNGILDIVRAVGRLDDIVAETVIRVGNEFRQVGDNLYDIGQRVLNTFSLKTLTESGAFDIATEFDALSSQLEVFGRLTEEQLVTAQAFADQIGIKYPLSANDALKATLDLVKAGQDLNAVYSILPAAADLASLSDTGSIEDATRTLIGATSAFDEFRNGVEGSFDNVAVASDVLAAAADVSTASIEDLAAGFADVGPIANIAGLTFEETAAALAILNDGQLRASEGGRGLRAALDSIFTRDKAKEEFAKLGIAIFDAEGNIRAFDDILKDLKARFAGFTEQQIVHSLGNIADTFGRTSLSILIARDGLSDVIDAMGETGTAAERAQKLLDNFRGDLDQLRGSAETALKNVFLPLIERAFRPLVQLLRQLIDGFLALPKEVQETAGTLLLILSTVATLIGSLSILSGVLLKVSGVFLTLGGNLLSVIINFQQTIFYVGALASSLAVIIPTVLALGAGLLYISEQVSTAFRLVAENVGGAGDAFENLKSIVSETFGEIVRIVKTFAQAVQFGFDAIFGQTDEERGAGLAGTFDTIAASISGFLDTLRSIDTAEIVRVFLVIRSQISGFIESVQRVISDVSKNVGSFIEPIQKAIAELLPEISRFVNNVITLFTNIGAETKDIPLVETLTEIIRFVRGFLTNQIRDITRLLDFLSTNILEPLAANIPVIIASIEKFVATVAYIFKPITDFVFGQGKIVIDFFSQLPTILSDLPSAGEVVRKFAEDFVQGLLGIPAAVGSTLERIGLEIGSSLLFFLGNGLLTGNFDAFLNTVGAALQQFFTSIPEFFIRIGEETGNTFIANFGLALKNGDINVIITTFFKLVEDLVFTALQNIVRTVADFARVLIQQLFPTSGVQEAGNEVVGFFDGIFAFITAPLRLAISALAKGLDIASVGIEIATTLVTNIVRTVLNLIPQTFRLIAESVENETVKQIFRGIADGIQTVTQSITTLLELPLKTLASALGALGTFLDLMEKIGLTSPASLAIITTLTLSLTGLGDAIIQFARQVTIRFIQPALLALQSLIFQIRSLARGTLLKVAREGVRLFAEGIKNAFSTAFTASVQRGANVYVAAFNGIASALKTFATAPFATIAAGLRSLGAGLRSLITAVAPFVLVTAAMTALQAALEAFSDSVQNGGSFILKFFENISVTVLNMLGFDELVPQFQDNIRLLEIILDDFFAKIGNGLRVHFINILQAFTDLRARLEQASADLGLTMESRFAQQFFAVGDTLNAAGQLSGQEFFNGLREAMNNPVDLNALKTQLIPFKDTIIREFTSLDFSEILANDFSLGVDIVRSLVNAEAIPDAFRAIQGDLDKVLDLSRVLQATDAEAFGANFGAFFEAALNSGITDSLNQLGKANYRDQVIAAFEQGALTQGQAQRFLDALGFSEDGLLLVAGELGVRFEVLSTSMNDLFATAQQSNLDDLEQQLIDGAISADEYQAALNELGEEIVETIDAIRQDKIAALTKQFDDGAISEAEYRRQLSLINAEAKETTLTELTAEIDRITEAAKNGSISFADAAKQISVIQEEINNVKSVSPALAKDMEKLTADFAAGTITGKEFADEFARITAEIEKAQAAAKDGVTTTVGSDGSVTTSEQAPPPIADQQEYNDLLKEEESLKEKIADFNRDEARRLEDDVREEQKKRDDIAKIRVEADEKERDAAIDFNIERQREEQDHQRRLIDIARNANSAFDDAIASRDSSAAQAAEKQLTEQKRSENEQFNIDKQRAEQDFLLNQERDRRERDQRIAAAQVELQDQIDQNARERARRLEDYNIDVAELQAKIDQERLVQQTANTNELAAEQQHQKNLATTFLNGMTQIQTAVSNGLPGVVNLFASALSQFTNQANAALAASAQAANAAFVARQTGQEPQGRADGGSVLGNKLYEVLDGKYPELLTQGNKTYLLPGKNGNVEPIKPLNQRASAAAGGNISIELNLGGINIDGSNGNLELIAATIEKRIVENTVDALKKQINSVRRI